MVRRTSLISPSLERNICAMDSMSAGGGSSATKRRASLVEMNLAVAGLLHSMSSTCSPSFMPFSEITLPMTVLGPGSCLVESKMNPQPCSVV